ncbi:uncharacterized protein [Porites lutea]|uniref:uncharacterized protein n=1 Tax=Porites lutea TaxID=51062 RepID=UPI003CC59205
MAKLIPMVVALLVMTVGRSEAIRWDKQPDKPTILVEGVNNTGESLKLVWNFVTEPSEIIDRVTFQRRRDDADPREDIASNKEGGAFNVFAKFISNYSASPLATLILRNPVTNDDEFIYSIVVSLSKNNLPEPSLTDQVQLIVFVPPRITTEPERESEVSVGQNLTLTCIASGDPLPEVTWSKVGQALRLFNVTGPVLHLVNITREDVGSYKCTAKNKVGEAFRTAVVNIASTPTWPSTHRPSPWTMHPPRPSTTTMHPPRPSTTAMHPPRPSTTRTSGAKCSSITRWWYPLDMLKRSHCPCFRSIAFTADLVTVLSYSIIITKVF